MQHHSPGNTSFGSAAISKLAEAQATLFGGGVPVGANIAVLMNPNAYSDLMGQTGADFTSGYLDMNARRVATMPYFVSANVGNASGSLQAKSSCFSY